MILVGRTPLNFHSGLLPASVSKRDQRPYDAMEIRYRKDRESSRLGEGPVELDR